MLVVQEKSGRFRGTGVWKLPTGVVDEVCVNENPVSYERVKLSNIEEI